MTLPIPLPITLEPARNETVSSWVARTGIALGIDGKRFVNRVSQEIGLADEQFPYEPGKWPFCVTWRQRQNLNAIKGSQIDSLARLLGRSNSTVEERLIGWRWPPHLQAWGIPNCIPPRVCCACLEEMRRHTGFVFEDLSWRLSLRSFCSLHGHMLKPWPNLYTYCGSRISAEPRNEGDRVFAWIAGPASLPAPTLAEFEISERQRTFEGQFCSDGIPTYPLLFGRGAANAGSAFFADLLALAQISGRSFEYLHLGRDSSIVGWTLLSDKSRLQLIDNAIVALEQE